MEYVIVEFPDRRDVLVDGISYGDNREVNNPQYRILRVPEGLRRFRLRGPDDYVPLWQTVMGSREFRDAMRAIDPTWTPDERPIDPALIAKACPAP